MNEALKAFLRTFMSSLHEILLFTYKPNHVFLTGIPGFDKDMISFI